MCRAAEELGRQLALARVEAVDRARRGARRDRVDEPESVGALPGVDQRGRLTLALEQLDAGRQRPLQATCDLQPGGIVAAPAVSDADDFQRRSTSSFRKCVAHEMHGS